MNIKQLFYWLIVILLLLGSISIMAYRLDEPVWEISHHGFHLVEYPHNALNYLRFGYWNTSLGMVMNYGPQPPSHGFDYRLDHPPMIALLISLSYQLFGVHNWAARLVPLSLTTGTIILTFLLARQLTTNRWAALIALIFCAFSPTYLFYGRMPAPHNLAVFFCMAAFYCYWRWFVSRKQFFLVSLAGMLFMGVATEWTAYFTVAPILIHYLVFVKPPRNWKFIICLAIAPILLFAFYILWAYWLDGDDSLHYLWHRFLDRTVSVGSFANTYTLSEAWITFYKRSHLWLTSPVFLLSVIWLGISGWQMLNWKLSPQAGLVMALFLFGFSHNVLFTNLVLVHDFAMFYHIVPACAIVASLSLAWIIASSNSNKRTALVGIVLGVVLYIFVEQAGGVVTDQHNRKANDLPEYDVGRTINTMVSDTGQYFNAAGLNWPRSLVIADRPVIDIRTFKEFTQRLNHKVEAIVAKNTADLQFEFRDHLLRHHPRTEVAGYSIFELGETGSNVLVEQPIIEHPRHLVFGDQIEYLGFDLTEIVYRQDEAIPDWQSYLNRYPELLPQYRTTFQVVNYWRKLNESSQDYKLLTHFEAQFEGTYRLESAYNGLDDIYPTSDWPVGQIIREAFEITVPPSYPSQKYDMWVSVRENNNNFLSNELKQVKVGQLDIRPTQPPVGITNTKKIQTLTPNIQINQEIALLGYDLTMTEAGPKITTQWQKIVTSQADYQFYFRLQTDSLTIDQQLNLPPPRLWEVGPVYQETVQWSPYLLNKQYQLSLVVQDEAGKTTEFLLTTVDWCRQTDLMPLYYLGQPNHSANDAVRLVPDRTQEIEFELSHPQDVELLIGWTGQSELAATRLKVLMQNNQWKLISDKKYLQTFVVEAGEPTISRVRIPAYLTMAGQNRLLLTMPERTFTGWRQFAVMLLPDLESMLQSSYLPYRGWLEVDFIQILAPPPEIDRVDIPSLSTEALLELYKNRTDSCLARQQQTQLEQVKTVLENRDLSTLSLPQLLTGQSNEPSQLATQIHNKISQKISRNIDTTMVNESAEAVVQVLGYTTHQKGDDLEMVIYFEPLQSLSENYVFRFFSQIGDTEVVFDHHPSPLTSEWQVGQIYQTTLTAPTTLPGDYHLSFGIYTPTNGNLFQLTNGTNVIDLGSHQIGQ